MHETDWFVTFVRLAGAALPTYALDGLDAWPALSATRSAEVDMDTLLVPAAGAPAYRNETLIGEAVLRIGQYKLIASMDFMLTYCVLGTDGGWIPLAVDQKDVCPFGKADGECTDTKQQLSAADRWLCSSPCTSDSPCLFDVVNDAEERHEISAAHPDVVKRMQARLAELQALEYKAPFPADNGRACAMAEASGWFVAPWLG